MHLFNWDVCYLRRKLTLLEELNILTGKKREIWTNSVFKSGRSRTRVLQNDLVSSLSGVTRDKQEIS